MKHDAVIFDLFGTLAHEPSQKRSLSILRGMATVLSIPSDDLARMWAETRTERGSPEFPTMEVYIEFLCSRMGVVKTESQIKQAVSLRTEWVRHLLQPREGAEETLSQLKTLDYRIGLVSNCGSETPPLWRETPIAPLIDVTVFSCEEGFNKPDIRMYQLAVERLGIEAGKCLYIGDGDSGELSGALSAGMDPVMIKVLLEDPSDDPRTKVGKWAGPKIDSIQDVLDILKGSKLLL